MKRFKKILVCLDRGDRDPTLIAFASRISELAGSEIVHLYHRAEYPGTPPALLEKHPGLVDSPDEIRQGIQQTLDAHYKSPAPTKITVATEGSSMPYDAIKFGREQDVDLIIVGREFHEGADSAADATKAKDVARKATCSVLTLARHNKPDVSKILVPYRDSECSANAMDAALAIAKGWANARVIGQYVYPIHAGYHSTGLTYDELVAAMQQQGRDELDLLKKRIDQPDAPIEPIFSGDEYDKPARIIDQTVREQNVDMLIIGARGRTGPAGVLLGSVTEQLISLCPVPILAVKKKGESLSLLDAILTIGG